MALTKLDLLLQRADAQYEAGNFRSSFRLFLAAANRGESGCQINLANLYASGLGVKPNRAKALYWYRRAFRRKDGAAAMNIGLLYLDEKKLDRALAWFGRAASLQDGDASLEIEQKSIF